jgi:hypothetical protein
MLSYAGSIFDDGVDCRWRVAKFTSNGGDGLVTFMLMDDFHFGLQVDHMTLSVR